MRLQNADRRRAGFGKFPLRVRLIEITKQYLPMRITAHTSTQLHLRRLGNLKRIESLVAAAQNWWTFISHAVGDQL